MVGRASLDPPYYAVHIKPVDLLVGQDSNLTADIRSDWKPDLPAGRPTHQIRADGLLRDSSKITPWPPGVLSIRSRRSGPETSYGIRGRSSPFAAKAARLPLTGDGPASALAAGTLRIETRSRPSVVARGVSGLRQNGTPFRRSSARTHRRVRAT